MANYAKNTSSWKQKKANREEREQRTNAVRGMLQNTRSSDKVKERFYRKPYGKKDEKIDICKDESEEVKDENNI